MALIGGTAVDSGLGMGRRANGAAPASDAAAVVALAACFAIYLWRFLPVAPGPGPMFADDYGLHLPNLLAGYFHFLVNGPFSVPWFSPAECAGLPFIADLNVAFYSLPQVLTLLVDPANAVRVTVVVFAALGVAGFHLLLRSRFAASPWAAATAAVLFLFNGFFVARIEVGHLTFHPFMLAPWIAWAALPPATLGARWTWRRVVLATVLVGAIFAYQFQAGMVHIIVPVALATAVIVLVHGHLRGHAWQPWAVLGLGAALSVGLSAQRLAAALAFLHAYPRSLYPLPGLRSAFDAIEVVGLSLFWHPPGVLAMSELENTKWFLGWHEWAYGVGPAALVLLVVGGVALLVRLVVGRTWRRPVSGLAVLAATFLAVAIPIALNVYSPGWNTFLKDLPVIGQSVALVRWFVLYIPLVVLGAALAVDRLASSRRWAAGGIFLAVAIATVWWNWQPHPVELNYNGASIERAWYQARVAGIPPITEIKWRMQSSAVGSVYDRNNAMVEGISEMLCYQPIFGYNLEDFPVGHLQIGTIYQQATAGELNFKNPSCYLFPKENSCAPGNQFRADQQAALEQFTTYHPFPFVQSAIQIAANWINLITLIASALAVLVALAWPRKRLPPETDRSLEEAVRSAVLHGM